MLTDTQQLYPPEPPLTFPPPTRSVLADQRYPPELPLSFPPPAQLLDVEGRGLRAEAHALTLEDLSRLSVGHATIDAPSHVLMAGGLLLVAVGVLLFAVVWRKDAGKNTTVERSVAFTDSYEPFLG